MPLLRLLLAWLLFAAMLGSAQARTNTTGVHAADLPVEARQTLALIERGGPFPYARDGVPFGNYEHRLPPRTRGYYREFTVPTPGLKNRGPRRIISGMEGERYYSADHYRSFGRIIP
jgi:ribonuclease T1